MHLTLALTRVVAHGPRLHLTPPNWLNKRARVYACPVSVRVRAFCAAASCRPLRASCLRLCPRIERGSSVPRRQSCLGIHVNHLPVSYLRLSSGIYSNLLATGRDLNHSFSEINIPNEKSIVVLAVAILGD